MGYLVPSIYPREVYVTSNDLNGQTRPFIGDIINAGTSLVDTVAGYATGSKDREIQSRLELARAEQLKASQKQANWPLIAGITVGGLVLAVGLAAYFRYKSLQKNAK